jgi:hypothetical protein
MPRRPLQPGGIIYDPAQENQRREEEERRRQEAARQQAEAARPKKAKETAKKKPSRNPLSGIQEAFSAADEAVENFVEQNIARPILGEKGFQENQKRQAEAETKRKESEKALEEAAYSGPINTIGTEAIRAAAKAPVNLIEGVLNTGELLKDTIGTGINTLRGKATPENRNPFSDRYEEARYDLGVNGAKTPVGKLAEGILTFAIGARHLGKVLPKGAVNLGTGGKGLKGAVASGIVPGALADFMLTKGDDGNLSTLVRDLDWVPPQYEDTLLLALAVDDDDNIWEAKLKSVIEGGVTGAAADSLTYLLWGRKAAQAAKKAGKSDAEALQEGLAAADAKANELDADAATRDAKEQDRWMRVRSIEYDMLQRKFETASQTLDRVIADFGEGSPEFNEALKAWEAISREVSDFDWEEIRRVDPSGLAPHEKAAYNESADINTAATAQLKAETGGVPNPARVMPAPGSTMPTTAGAPKVLTDAAYRIMDMPGETEKMVKEFVKQSDLQKVARSLKRSYNQVVRDAASIVEEFRDATLRYDEQTVPITKLLEKGGTITVDRGTGMETLLSPEGVVATKALISDTANQIYDLATNADMMAQIRAAGGNQYDRLVDRLLGLVELHKVTGNFHGFGLGAFQESIGGAPRGIRDADAGELNSIAKMKEWGIRVKKLARQGDPKAQEEMENLVKAMVLAGGDPTKTVRFGQLAAKIGTENLLKGMYQSLLSGPITHFRNLIGNGYAAVERPMSIALNGFLTGDEAKKRAAVAGFSALRTSMSDAWAIARQTLATGEPLHINRKFVLDDAELLATIERMKMTASGPIQKTAIGFLEAQYHFLNQPWMSLPSNLLMASDEFFKHINARQHLAAEAMYKAVMDTKDPNQIDGVFQQYMREFSKKIDPKTGEILDENLLDYAETATFQGDPGSFINKLTVALEEQPIARIFVPFIRTPANMLAYAGQHTPGLNRFLGSYRRVMEGSDELLKAEMRGRQATGAITFGSATVLALSGLMTGNGPYDQQERALWLKTHQPRSLRIGNKWVSYESLEPLATIMTTVADIALLARMGNQSFAEKLAGQTIFALTAAITEKSYLAGLTAIAAVLDPSNLSAGNKVTAGLLATGNNFLPLAGARRALANSLDPYIKEVNNELERALANATPGFKNFMPNRTDIFTGEPIQAVGGGIWNAVMPFRIRDAGEDPVQDALVAMEYEYNQVTKGGPQGEPLTAQEQATLSRYIYETGVYDRLKDLVQQDWFRESVVAYANRAGELDKRDTRHYIAVDKLLSRAKRAAFTRMRHEDDDFANRIQARSAAAVSARRGDITGAVQRLQQMPK